MHDPVNQPVHYTSGAVECIDAIEASMSAEAFKGFLKGNIQKYVWRYETKGGVQSLQKAQWYLNRLIALEESTSSTAQSDLEMVVNYDPDDHLKSSGCPDGFCPMPNVRLRPSESMFPPVKQH